MLKAKRKRLREEQESMDGVEPVRNNPSPTLTLSEGMNCRSEPPHPAKRACVNLCAANVRVLKEEDPVDISIHVPTEEVSKLEPPAVKRPQARYVDFGAAAELMSNASGGFGQDGQEGQDEKEEEIARPDYRDEGDGIKEEAKDGLLNDEEVNAQEKKTDSHLEDRRQKTTSKSFEKRIEELVAFKAKHGHVRVTVKHDKSLGVFCKNMRSARRRTGGGGTVITEDRFKALDELGFEWEVKNNSFYERIEELRAFKEKHGHVRVLQ